MKIEIKNGYLEQAISLLFDLSLKGKESRQRTKFIKLLNDQLKEVDEGRVQLAEEHSEKNGEGKPIINDNKYKIADLKQFQADLAELYDEVIIIDGANNKYMLKTVKKIIEECDEKFSGEKATIYNYLYEQFEGEDK